MYKKGLKSMGFQPFVLAASFSSTITFTSQETAFLMNSDGLSDLCTISFQKASDE